MSVAPVFALPTVHEDADTATRRARFFYLARRGLTRIVQGAAVVWAAGTLIFIAVHIAPGEVIDTLLGANSNDIELRKQITQEWGLDHPPTVQYLLYFARLLRGDLGQSYVQHRSVNSLLADQLPSTIELTLWGFGFAVLLAIVLATFTSGRSRIGKAVSQSFELTLVSVPPFWLGMLLLSIFSFRLGWFPVAGTSGFQAVVLPALAIGLPIGCFLAQVLREGLDRALEQPFALTARARGASLMGVKWVHALRHASLPALTIGGLTFGNLLGGAVICEQVFGRPGIGRLAVQAINTTDIPVILAVGMLSAVFFVVITTVIDLVYLAVDPRLRSEAQWRETTR